MISLSLMTLFTDTAFFAGEVSTISGEDTSSCKVHAKTHRAVCLARFGPWDVKSFLELSALPQLT
jgi:hypothetical protein